MKTLFDWILALGMLVTGSINTLSTKGADRQVAMGDDEFCSFPHPFSHPFVQAAGMFLGETLCLAAFGFLVLREKKCQGKRVATAKPHNPLIFWLPALCDMTATSLMYVGLSYTTASYFQMLRGAVVIFTGLLSVVFLRRKIPAYQWVGMALVTIGVVLVGISNLVCGDGGSSEAPNVTVGNILVISAQIVVAFQMVVEEKFIKGYDIPALQTVGWEGVFGLFSISILIVVFAFIPTSQFCQGGATGCCLNNSNIHMEDPVDAFKQIGSSGSLALFLAGNVLSIAFFNFFGISVTRHMNSATRMVLDSVRTIVIWGGTYAFGWAHGAPCWSQIVGFVILILGTMIHNAVFKLPKFNYSEEEEKPSDKEGLLNDADDLKRSINVALDEDGDGSYAVPPESPLVPSMDKLYSPSLRKATAMRHQ